MDYEKMIDENLDAVLYQGVSYDAVLQSVGEQKRAQEVRQQARHISSNLFSRASDGKSPRNIKSSKTDELVKKFALKLLSKVRDH